MKEPSIRDVNARHYKTHGGIQTGSADIQIVEIADSPYIYEIEPTNACPYRCYMCPRGIGKMKRPVGFIEKDTFERVLAQVPSRQRMLRLHHFGESLLHPQIFSFIKLTRQAGIIPVLSLNPSSLKWMLIDQIIDSGIGIVCFSLDSLNSERLNTIRGVTKSADYCLRMIDHFIEKSRYARHPVFKIIQMVSLALNRDEQQTYMSFFKEKYPGDDVYTYISGNYGFGDAQLISETSGGEEFCLTAENVTCSAPFDDIVVLWNGDVVLCCFDYDGFNVIGNVNKNSIDDIWRSESATEIRDAFTKREVKKNPLCKKCFMSPNNSKIIQPCNMKRGDSEEAYILNLFFPYASRLSL